MAPPLARRAVNAYLQASTSPWSYAMLLLGATAALLAASAVTPAPSGGGGYAEAVAAAEALLERDSERNEKAFREYVGYETISKHRKRYLPSLEACADFLAGVFADRLGFENAATYSSADFPVPIVVGSSAPFASSKPSFIIYGHYDVQPVDGEWTISEPFEMKRITLEGFGEVYTGRGSQDDKGNTWSAVTALAALNDSLDGGLASLPINVILIIEGEEEAGSNGFKGFFIEEHAEVFARARLMLCGDGSQPFADRGALQLSNRGGVSAQLDVKGADSDLHSGMHGGSILNPLVAASRIVASLHDPATNRIAVEGYYDSVIELTPEERAELDAGDEAAEAAALGVAAMVGEEGYTSAERASVRPTLEVIGMSGGFTDEGIKTVLPSRARAKFSMRLVNGQDPDTAWGLLDAHVAGVKGRLRPGTTVELTRMGKGGRAYIADRDSVGSRLAAETLDEVYGVPSTVYRMGGSVPITGHLNDVLGLESVTLAFGLNDGHIHAPDERHRLSCLRKGQRAYIRMILKLAAALPVGGGGGGDDEEL